jgi:hypothetical protein
LRGNNVCSLKSSAAFYVFNFHTPRSPPIFTNNATINSAFVNINTLIKRYCLYFLYVFRSLFRRFF